MTVEYNVDLYKRFADWEEKTFAELDPDAPVLVIEANLYPKGTQGRRESVGHTRYFVPPKSEEN